MGDEKQTDDTQSDLSIATESLKLEGDLKENGESTKTDKVKSLYLLSFHTAVC